MSSSSDSSLSASQIDYPSSPETREPRLRFIDANLVTLLDGLGLRDRDSVRLICAVLTALKYDLDKVVVSRSTIRRMRTENRAKTASLIKEKFEVCY